MYVCDRSECWGDAMLGKQVGGAGNGAAFRFKDIIQVAAVVIPRQPKKPCIKAVGCPQCHRVGIFIDYCLGTKWCQGVSIPVIWTFEYFIR